MKKTVNFSAVLFLLVELTGCYYPVPYPAYPYGYVTAAPPFAPSNPRQECRNYEKTAIIEGKEQQLNGTACLQPNGIWKDPVNGLQINMSPANKN